MQTCYNEVNYNKCKLTVYVGFFKSVNKTKNADKVLSNSKQLVLKMKRHAVQIDWHLRRLNQFFKAISRLNFAAFKKRFLLGIYIWIGLY